jgi:hypothetical protein
MSKELKHWILNKETGSIIAEVYNDDRFEDGTYITTTPVVSMEDGIIKTKSGTTYVLKESYVSSLSDISSFLDK